jgi:3-hydroxy-9,10-secoandrosta-1,3,5(10)-triene-9,17-dione monooxygenase reductase component
MSSEGAPKGTPGLDHRRFCLACGRYTTGVVIATVLDAQGEPHGITINSFTSVSLAPPLILFCLDHRARILSHFRSCRNFGINVLNEHQRDVSQHFASSKRDRFNGIDWRKGELAVPLLTRGLAFLECTVRNRVASGDHDIIIGEVVAARVEEGRPLVYFGSKYRKLDAVDS